MDHNNSHRQLIYHATTCRWAPKVDFCHPPCHRQDRETALSQFSKDNKPKIFRSQQSTSSADTAYSWSVFVQYSAWRSRRSTLCRQSHRRYFISRLWLVSLLCGLLRYSLVWSLFKFVIVSSLPYPILDWEEHVPTMFEKSLYDLIQGLRNHKRNEREYIQNIIRECRAEIRGPDMGWSIIYYAWGTDLMSCRS